MLRVGDALVQLLWYGGGLGRAIVLSGLLALPAALYSLVAALLRRDHARGWGAVTLLLAALPMGLGAAATLHGRMEAAGAVQLVAPGYREQMVRQGFLEARLFSQGGLVLGGFPLVAGAAALLASTARRTHSARPRRGQALAAGAASDRPERHLSTLRTIRIPFAVALLAAAGALWGACATIPDDPDLAPARAEPLGVRPAGAARTAAGSSALRCFFGSGAMPLFRAHRQTASPGRCKSLDKHHAGRLVLSQ